jgi:CHAT domain-containing protein
VFRSIRLPVLVGLAFVSSPAFAAAPPAPLTPAQQQQLRIQARLLLRINDAIAAGNATEAMPVARRALAIERAVFGQVRPVRANTLEWLAQQHDQREEFGEAAELYEELKRLFTFLYGPGSWRVFDADWQVRNVRQAARMTAGQRRRRRTALQQHALLVQRFNQRKRAEVVAVAQRVLALFKEVLGEKNPTYAVSLGNLGLAYHLAGDHARAVPVLQQAVNVWKEVAGEKHPEYAAALHNLAALYQDMGQFAKALPLAQQALKLRRQVLGPRDPQYARSLKLLAALHRNLGEYARALPLFRQVVALTREVRGEKHEEFAASLNYLGMLLTDMGEFPEALQTLRNALRLRKQLFGEKDAAVAQSLHNLAQLHSAMGENGKALALEQQAVKVMREVFGMKHPVYTLGLKTLADFHQGVGNYLQALELYEQSMKLDRAARRDRHPGYADSLNNLANLQHTLGNHARAVLLSEQALKLIRETLGTKHPTYAAALNNLATLYSDMGDHVRALALYRQSSKLTRETDGEKHPNYARSLNNLAMAYKESGEYQKALDLYLEVVRRFKEAESETDPACIAALHNLASLYLLAGEHRLALPLFEQTLRWRRERLGERHRDYGTSLNSLASTYQQMGQPDKALPLFLQALDVLRGSLGEQHPEYAAQLFNLAVLHAYQRNFARALPLAWQALAISRRQLDLNAFVQSERQQMAAAVTVRFRLDTFLSMSRDSSLPASVAHTEVLAWKGSAFARQRLRRLAASTSNPAVRKLLHELEETTRELATLALGTAPLRNQQARERRLAELTERKEQIEVELFRTSTAFRKERTSARLPSSRLAQSLPAGTALVDFLVYNHGDPTIADVHKSSESRLAAFILRRDKPVVRLDLGAMAAIDRAIGEWRGKIEKGQTGVDVAGAAVRKRLWQPLEPYLKGTKTVLLSPDGALARLPFAALPGSKEGTVLLEEMAVVTVPVPHLLPDLLEKPLPARDKPPPAMLLVGGVDFGALPGGKLVVADSRQPSAPRLSGKNWPALPGTLAEVEAVKALFNARHKDGKTKELLGARATKAAVRPAMREHRYLHLATHGFFTPASVRSALESSRSARRDDYFGQAGVSGWHPGLLCGIVLAGANKEPKEGAEDSILTALEVAQQDLSGVELAVLSACETGLGEVAGGEGVLGLQRAFQVAGARCTVTSLWSVNDSSTSLLMEAFYDRLWSEGKPSRVEALRQAQLFVMRNPAKIAERAKQLRAALLARGISEQALEARGLSKKAGRLPGGGGAGKERAPVELWAAFVLSGDWR